MWGTLWSVARTEPKEPNLDGRLVPAWRRITACKERDARFLLAILRVYRLGWTMLSGNLGETKMSGSARILCIGKDSGVLRSRCAILEDAGYQAQAVFFVDAEEEREHIATIAGGATPILQVTKTILASELLAEVEQRRHRC
jgi:hypothetical protein